MVHLKYCTLSVIIGGKLNRISTLMPLPLWDIKDKRKENVVGHRFKLKSEPTVGELNQS